MINVVSAKVYVRNPQGLHMRPAQIFVTEMSKFSCEVRILTGEKEINAKSIMFLMAAHIKCGSEIEVRCSGPEEETALQTALSLIESNLDE